MAFLPLQKCGIAALDILILNFHFMDWSAQITDKSELSQEGLLTYSFITLADGEAVGGTFTVTGSPSEIQQMVSARVTAYAEAYELAGTLPAVGEVFEIITTE